MIMRIKRNKVLVSARCSSKSKKFIKDSNYTYGDALEFFAKIITNSPTRLYAEIRFTQAEIEDIKRKQLKYSMELVAKETYLKNLMNERNSCQKMCKMSINNNEELKKSLDSIKTMASQFNCEPLEINKFTGFDTLRFHAQKCGLTRFEIETIITSPEEE